MCRRLSSSLGIQQRDVKMAAAAAAADASCDIPDDGGGAGCRGGGAGGGVDGGGCLQGRDVGSGGNGGSGLVGNGTGGYRQFGVVGEELMMRLFSRSPRGCRCSHPFVLFAKV